MEAEEEGRARWLRSKGTAREAIRESSEKGSCRTGRVSRAHLHLEESCHGVVAGRDLCEHGPDHLHTDKSRYEEG